MNQIAKVPRLWGCNTYLSTGIRGPFVPDVDVDITGQWPRKLAVIRAHHSQRPEWWIALTERQRGLHGQRYTPREMPPERFYAEGFKRIIPLGFIEPVAYLDT